MEACRLLPAQLISDVGGGVLLPAQLISDIGGRILLPAQLISDIGGRVLLPAQLISDIGGRILLPAQLISDVGGRVLLPAQLISDVGGGVLLPAQLISDVGGGVLLPAQPKATALGSFLCPPVAHTPKTLSSVGPATGPSTLRLWRGRGEELSRLACVTFYFICIFVNRTEELPIIIPNLLLLLVAFLYSAILRSRAYSLHSHVILPEWPAFCSVFLNIHRSGKPKLWTRPSSLSNGHEI